MTEIPITPDRPPFDPEAFVSKVENFVKENIQPAKDDSTRCVDGRYENDDEGKIAFAGGDLGLVMALAAVNKVAGLNMAIEECFDYIHDVVSEDGLFCMHTDDHDHGEGGIGCGHAAKAADPGTSADYIKFLIDQTQDSDAMRALERDFQQDMRDLIAYATKRATVDDVENVVLEGSHAEEGVIIVDSKEYTIRHQGKDGGQYFVFDRLRANNHIEATLDKLISLLESRGIAFTEDHKNMFLDAFTQQTNATLHHLAKGKGIAQVEIDADGNSSVSFVQVVS